MDFSYFSLGGNDVLEFESVKLNQVRLRHITSSETNLNYMSLY